MILNTGSISGESGIATQGAYGPSKGAVHQMTRQMAIEYAPFGIRVNAIACGTVDTPIVHRSAAASGDPDRYWAMLRENHPIGRIASPEEVASFFTYMASDGILSSDIASVYIQVTDNAPQASNAAYSTLHDELLSRYGSPTGGEASTM